MLRAFVQCRRIVRIEYSLNDLRIAESYLRMNFLQIENQIKYVTNAASEKTEVIIPLELWNSLVNSLEPTDSGLNEIDEAEPKSQILADLQKSLRQAAAGQHYPLEELWTGVDVDGQGFDGSV